MVFSIVIPLYNKAAYIQRALDSVFAQTCGDYEIVIVDDGSTDGSAEIVRSNGDSRVRLLGQDNAGAGIARDRGWREARGEFVAFLDADDEWRPEFLAHALLLLRDYPIAGAGGLGYALCDDHGEVRSAPISSISADPWRGILPDFFAASLSYPPLWSSATVIPRRVLCSVNPKVSRAKLGEDQYFFGQVAIEYPIAYENTILAYYHIGAQGRVCNSCQYIGELPFITLIRKQKCTKGAQGSNWRSIRRFITKSQMITASRLIDCGADKRIAKQLLRHCRPVPHQYIQWVQTFVRVLLCRSKASARLPERYFAIHPRSYGQRP